MRESAPRSRLHRSERDVEETRHLALREPAPVCELEYLPLALGKRLQRAVYAPRDIRRLRALGRPRRVPDHARWLHGQLGPRTRPGDAPVAAVRTHPTRSRPALQP